MCNLCHALWENCQDSLQGGPRVACCMSSFDTTDTTMLTALQGFATLLGEDSAAAVGFKSDCGVYDLILTSSSVVLVIRSRFPGRANFGQLTLTPSARASPLSSHQARQPAEALERRRARSIRGQAQRCSVLRVLKSNVILHCSST